MFSSKLTKNNLIFTAALSAVLTIGFLYISRESPEPQDNQSAQHSQPFSTSSEIPVCKPTSNPSAANITGLYGVGMQRNPWEFDARSLTAADDLGVSAVRLDFKWDYIEPKKGDFNYSLYDQQIPELARRGISILGILNSSPNWLFRAIRENAEKAALVDFRDVLQKKNYPSAYTDIAESYVRKIKSPAREAQLWLATLPAKEQADVTDAFRAAEHRYNETFKEFSDWEDIYRLVENFAYETVRRYKSSVRYWEVWNEPNFPCCGWIMPYPEPTQYRNVLAYANRGIRRADPAAIISFAGLSPDGYPPIDFVKKVYELGGKNCFDILNFHPYGKIENLPAWTDKFKKLASQNGDAGKPVWFTEYGTQTAGPEKEMDEAGQAKLLEQSFDFFIKGGVPAFFWYALEEDSDNPNTTGKYGLIRADWTPKPAYETLKKLLRTIPI